MDLALALHAELGIHPLVVDLLELSPHRFKHVFRRK